jgi:hypothetical protein
MATVGSEAASTKGIESGILAIACLMLDAKRTNSAAVAAPKVKPKTRSPGAKAVIAGPTAEMMPAKSWPIIRGSLRLIGM